MSKRTIRRAAILAALAAITALTSMAGAASAATVTYSSTTAFAVPNNTGIAGIDQVVNVPAGLTPVQKVEVPMAPAFPAGGGADLSYLNSCGVDTM
jgi:Rieske Fe-S protein